MDDDQLSELGALERILIDPSAVPIKLSYAVIKFITNNFSWEIGRGGFGVVYLGALQKGRVAVKKLITSLDFSDDQFVVEVNCLIRAKHRNIVRFLGYCSDTQGEFIPMDQKYVIADVRQRLLCFEYISNGNLHRYLEEKCHGDEWNIRYKILQGICLGLHFLHQQRINHLDLKPENVLLDAHMEPKITDFGLSRDFDEKQSRIFTQTFRGTLGYVAPEFIEKGEISFKSDIFSLGIIMIKLIIGRNDYSIDNWHDCINVECPQMKRCIEVAQICVDRDQFSRPSISEIICKLEIETMFPEVPLATAELRNDLWSLSHQDNVPTFEGMDYGNDDDMWFEFYKNNILETENASDDEPDLRPSQPAAATHGALTEEFDSHFIEAGQPILDTYHMVGQEEKLPYNILPLNPECNNHAIMRYPEIQGAVYALQIITGLQWPARHERSDKMHNGRDLFDWLQVTFGFQKDNASNQREHLILLLANVQARQKPTPDQQSKLDDQALDAVMKKLLKNYKKWCKYLGHNSNLWLPTILPEAQQHKILYLGLYLLIWGEASNLRFMPECLCYIYHHMAFELYGILAKHVNTMTGGNVMPAYGGDEEAFLIKVVTPIYKVIEKEAQRIGSIKPNHSYWRNYDDLNEYFWSNDCFQLGWPMRTDADFFGTPKAAYPNHHKVENMSASTVHWMGKVNFAEIRSFLHIFHSFDRMWTFLVLCLQAMIVVAWNVGTPSDILNIGVFKQVLSIFITAVILNFGKAFLEVVFSWRARRSMSFSVKLRYIMKLISAIIWAVILPISYMQTWENPTFLPRKMEAVLGDSQNHPYLYIMALLIYLTPNMLAAMLFVFPSLFKFLDSSKVKVITMMMWWSQPHLFVGTQMYEGAFSILKYTMFWALLLVMKLTVNFYGEIKPMVQATKEILREPIRTFQCDECFLCAYQKKIVIILLWAPIILVYFMDTHIWFACFSTLVGGIYGDYYRLGEIQTMGMLRSRFETLVEVFKERMIPSEEKKKKDSGSAFLSKPKVYNDKKECSIIDARFAQIWNTIITTLREEDLINNWEKDFLFVPTSEYHHLDMIQWPLFLLASKIPTALDMIEDIGANDYDLKMRMETDLYLSYAIKEYYTSSRNIINDLIFGQHEKKVIQEIFKTIDKYIEDGILIEKMNMRNLPTLSKKFLELLKLLLKNKEEDNFQVIFLFQDMIELVTMDIMEKDQLSSQLDFIKNGSNHLFTKGIKFPMEESNASTEKIKRLHFLVSFKDLAIEVPRNLDARRRIVFFANSLFMDMPHAPKVQNMLPFCVLTPYYNQDVLLSIRRLQELNKDGISILFYLQKIYPDEWKNFLERMHAIDEVGLWEKETPEEERRLWASYRMQTLTRTVRGMMYYRKALELQAFLDIAKDDDRMEGYGATEIMSEESELITQCKAMVDMKFTYVVSCHLYGIHKRSSDPISHEIQNLMITYPSLRVAYIDEVEVLCQHRNKKVEKVYYSCLVKASERYQNVDQEIYRIKLPGNPFLGVGKDENQNHAVIFTRGECLQTIATNQEHYMEEALKMRNLLQEFLNRNDGARYPSLLGVREHIFTGSVSSLAWFASNQESSFVTIEQRVLANLLRVRFHYGHSDIFDRLFHITRGGLSKASKILNHSSNGIFGGFNSTLREGSVTHREYMQVGRGVDVGLNQISLQEAIIANSNGEQTLSRDIYRLGQGFDFCRMLSCYHTTIGSYFNTMIAVWAIYVFLYGRLYLVLSGLDDALTVERWFVRNAPLQFALASGCFVQLGFLMVLPMIMEIGLERGFIAGLCDFVLMQLLAASVFFSFLLGTRTHYYQKTILHGGAKHRATGRKIVVSHVEFAENYRRYSRSHFVKGIELMTLLVVHETFGHSYRREMPYFLINISMWFMLGSWLFAPFLFNPSGFEWQEMVEDWTDWNRWINSRGGSGVAQEKSWESWWEREQEPLQASGMRGTAAEIILALRFFTYQYGLVYNFKIAKHIRSIMVNGFSLVFLFATLLVMKTQSVSRRRLRANIQLAIPLIKCAIFVRCFYILVILVGHSNLTVLEIFVFILSFIPTGWGLLLIAQAMKPAVDRIGLWGTVKAVARGYDMLTGLLLFIPVAFLAWFPFVSEVQSRLLFNFAFSRGLQISRILGDYRID